MGQHQTNANRCQVVRRKRQVPTPGRPRPQGAAARLCGHVLSAPRHNEIARLASNPPRRRRPARKDVREQQRQKPHRGRNTAHPRPQVSNGQIRGKPSKTWNYRRRPPIRLQGTPTNAPRHVNNFMHSRRRLSPARDLRHNRAKRSDT